MSGWRIIPIFLTFIILFASTMFANAEEDIENLIDIVTANGKVIAIIRGTRVKPVDLLRREKVLWTEARGNLGAFLTDSRFFVISTTSPD